MTDPRPDLTEDNVCLDVEPDVPPRRSVRCICTLCASPVVGTVYCYRAALSDKQIYLDIPEIGPAGLQLRGKCDCGCSNPIMIFCPRCSKMVSAPTGSA